MRRILIGLVLLLPLISFAHAGILDSILGIHSNTISNSTTTILASNSTASLPQNTSIATNASAGNLSLISSGQGQYNYQVILPKTLMNGSSIFTFYLLGQYNGSLGFQYPASVSCSTTSQITCTAVFIVTIGSYDRLEIIRNGIWLYALKLPKSIITSQTRSITTVTQKTNNNIYYILGFFGIIGAIMLIGNVSYDRYRIWKNPNAYNEVNP
jgi:hypothetical protein